MTFYSVKAEITTISAISYAKHGTSPWILTIHSYTSIYMQIAPDLQSSVVAYSLVVFRHIFMNKSDTFIGTSLKQPPKWKIYIHINSYKMISRYMHIVTMGQYYIFWLYG